MVKYWKQMAATAMALPMVVGLSLGAAPADAQVLPPFNPRATALSTSDQQAIAQATFGLLQQRTANVSTTWAGKATARVGGKSTSTGSNGTIKVVRVFDKDGRPCAEVENTFALKSDPAGSTPRRYVLEYCRLSTGLWRN